MLITRLYAGLKPDLFTYKALVHGFCKIKDTENAKVFVFCMFNDRLSPNNCNEVMVLNLPEECQ